MFSASEWSWKTGLEERKVEEEQIGTREADLELNQDELEGTTRSETGGADDHTRRR